MTRSLRRTLSAGSTLALALGLLLLAPEARAADTVITKNRQTGTIDGKGGVVKVMGNHSTLTIKNASKVSVLGNRNTLTLDGCAALDVMGNQNTIKAGTTRTISVMGNGNTITYQPGPKGEKPSVSNVGNGNQVSPAR